MVMRHASARCLLAVFKILNEDWAEITQDCNLNVSCCGRADSCARFPTCMVLPIVTGATSLSAWRSFCYGSEHDVAFGAYHTT